MDELKQIIAELEKRATEITDEERQKIGAERLEKTTQLMVMLKEIKEIKENTRYDEEERLKRYEEDKVAYDELKSEGFDPFARNHMPNNLARMIVGELCKPSLLKEEVELLSSSSGQEKYEGRLVRENKANRAVFGGGPGIFRRG
jgi:hypothetical protein